uniref:Uncharacterized protein n=1 Tax=Candidozyma auris TaxID=498019 RepID=A0A0L0P1W8_CANAR
MVITSLWVRLLRRTDVTDNIMVVTLRGWDREEKPMKFGFLMGISIQKLDGQDQRSLGEGVCRV